MLPTAWPSRSNPPRGQVTFGSVIDKEHNEGER